MNDDQIGWLKSVIKLHAVHFINPHDGSINQVKGVGMMGEEPKEPGASFQYGGYAALYNVQLRDFAIVNRLGE